MSATGAGWRGSGAATASAVALAVGGALERRHVAVAAIAVLFAVQAAIRFTSHLAPEVAWYLYAGGRLLDGAGLYEDVVEVNPPLGLWLSALVAAVAQTTGIGSTVLLKLALLALTALSVGLSARFIAAADDISAGTRNLILIFIAGLLLFLPGADFGQRDHVMIVLVCPFVLLRWSRLIEREVPAALAATVGLLAATGFWLKPHFLFAALAVEIATILAGHSLRAVVRIESLAVIAFGAVYLIATSMLFGRMLAEMSSLTTIAFIPLHGQGADELAVSLILPSALAAAAIAGTASLSSQLQSLRALLVAVGAALLFVFVIQAGYPYQLMPATFFLALAAGLGVARAFAGEVALDGGLPRVAAVGSLIVIAVLFAEAGQRQIVAYRGESFEEVIAVEAPDARSVFIASTSVAHPFPLVEEKGLTWASRFPSQWLAAYVARTLDETGAPSDRTGRFALEAAVDDLAAFEPDIVFIDEDPGRVLFGGRPFDYLAFWNNSAAFRRLWQAYEKRGVADGFGVYVKRDGAARR